MPTIAAIAVEDEEIDFVSRSFDARVDNLHDPVEPDTFIKKPEGGYSRDFLRESLRSFSENTKDPDVLAVGISMFGVIDVENARLLSVPSRDWSKREFKPEIGSKINLDFKSIFQNGPWSRTKVEIRNDATAAALGEAQKHKEGSRDGGGVFAYVRVGAGINAGVLRNGRPLRYRLHPEVGHIRPIRHFRDQFLGCCDFHQNCFEGLATARAIMERAGCSLDELDEQPENEAWHIQAYYLAQLCVILTMTVAPNCIVLGGSTMRQHIMENIRVIYEELVGTYPRWDQNEHPDYIRLAKITKCASLHGALWLAHLRALTPNSRGVWW